MALLTFTGEIIPLSATVETGTDLINIPITPEVNSQGGLISINVGYVTNPPPTTGIVYPLYR